MITDEVLSVVEYKDGGLYWTKQIHKSRSTKGLRVGGLDPDGYRVLTYKGKKYFEHRLIFLLHNNYLPKEIDHIDRNPLNNSIENLREATRSLNTLNTRSKNIYKYKTKWKTEVAGKHMGVFECFGKALKIVRAEKERLINVQSNS